MLMREKDDKRQMTIKKNIVKNFIFMIGISMVLLGGVTCVLNYISTSNTLERTMSETVRLASENVTQKLLTAKNIVHGLGCTERIADSQFPLEEKQELLNQKVKENGYSGGNLYTLEGVSLFDSSNISSTDYFKQAKSGMIVVTEPIFNAASGRMEVILAGPLWKNGESGTEVTGVVCLIPEENFLDRIVSEIQVSKNGSAYMIDKNGYTIAHKNHQLILDRENTVNDAKGDSSLKALAAIESSMAAGKSGFDTYTYHGVKKFLAYISVEGTDGWSIGVNAPISDFMGSTIFGVILTFVFIAAAIIIAIFRTIKIADAIATPIQQCAQRLNLLAQGDLHSEIPVVLRKDETKVLADATDTIVEDMKRIIDDISYLLYEMSQGNFNVHSKAPESYTGDFDAIHVGLHDLSVRLSGILRQVTEVAEQVALSANQLSEGAIVLAEGATDQASSVEELLATVNNVTEQVVNNSKQAEYTGKSALQMGEQADLSMQKMRYLMDAMKKIHLTSQQIEGIIANIEEIASQTNLLSLNASIEAARAGEAGRGFAVVAGEIGSLARQSAEAADNTRKLIAQSLHEVEDGNQAAKITSEAMEQLVQGLEKIVLSIDEVGSASANQADAMQQLNEGIEQISDVVQTNSSTAEESSAASEELSAQAATMKELAGSFQLREEENTKN